MHYVIAILSPLIPLLIALRVRKELPNRRTLGAAIVVGATGLGLIAGIVLAIYYDQWRVEHDLQTGMQRLHDRMCSEPIPQQPEAAALRRIGCAKDSRSCEVKSEAVAVSVLLTDDLGVVIPLRSRIAPSGKTYWVWLLDAANKVVDSVALQGDLPPFLTKNLSTATSCAVSLEVGPVAQPSSAIASGTVVGALP